MSATNSGATTDAASNGPVRGESVRAILTAVVLLLFAIGMSLLATTFGDEARRLPLVVGIPLSIMAVINLVLVVRAERERRNPVEPGDADAETDSGEDAAAAMRRAAQKSESEVEPGVGVSFKAAMTTLAVLTALFFLIGFIPTTVIFTIGFMRGVGGESWRKSVAMAVGLIVFFWVFRMTLDVRYYEGWLAAEEYIPYVLPF